MLLNLLTVLPIVESNVFCMIYRLRLYSVICGSNDMEVSAEPDQWQLLAWLGKTRTMWLKYVLLVFDLSAPFSDSLENGAVQ
jgi:hypothetical protein